MENENLSEMTTEELREQAKKLKSFSITNAAFIGFLAGIVVYSVAKNTWGLFTLIPLFFIYKLVNDPKSKRSKEINQLLQERNQKQR
jgi:hypothetical protein